MASLLIVAHAPLASALKSVATHTFPELADAMQALDVDASEGPEQVEMRLRAMLPAGVDAEALILADVFGATPCNAALRLAEAPRVRVVAGVNVPMLWRALCYRSEPLDSLVARAVGGATHGVVPVAAMRQLNQPSNANFHDQVQHHDQQ